VVQVTTHEGGEPVTNPSHPGAPDWDGDTLIGKTGVVTDLFPNEFANTNIRFDRLTELLAFSDVDLDLVGGRAMSPKAKPQSALMFGYSRVSAEEQAEKRNGLESQRATIDAEAGRRGWSAEASPATPRSHGGTKPTRVIRRLVARRYSARLHHVVKQV
jgi:hypothetical protein